MTPLKNYANAFFIIGIVCLSIAIPVGVGAVRDLREVEREIKSIREFVSEIPFLNFAYRAFGISEVPSLLTHKRKTSRYLFFLALLLVVMGLFLVLVSGVKFNRADTLLGDTFIRCPFCLGSNVTFDVAFFRFTDRVICRDCHALWEFSFNVLFKLYLRLVDYGTALNEKEKKTVPNTDDPEQWRTWAKERFKQERRPSPVSLPAQGQTLFCRFCGHPNLPDANFCSACGRKLKA